MARLSFLALVALCCSSVVFSTPLQQEFSLQTGGEAHTTDSWSYQDCGLPSDVIEIDSITVSPDPPQPGKDLTVRVKGKAKDEIAWGAYADVTVKLGLIKLLQKRFDVCAEAENADADIQCPVEAGTYEVVQTVALPKEIPRAKFTVAVRGYTAADDDMLCLDLKVDFMKKPFPRLW